MTRGATSRSGLNDALLFNRRLWTIFLDAVMSETNRLPAAGSREHQAARGVHHGGDVLPDDQSEAGPPDVDHQDQSRHRRRSARQSLKSATSRPSPGSRWRRRCRQRTNAIRRRAAYPVGAARADAVCVSHPSWRRGSAYKKALPWWRPKNRKIRAARRENRHPTAPLRTDQASRNLRLRRLRPREKAFFADRGCRRAVPRDTNHRARATALCRPSDSPVCFNRADASSSARIADDRLVQERLANLELELHRAAIDPLKIGPMHHAQTLFLHETAGAIRLRKGVFERRIAREQFVGAFAA